MKNQSNRFAAFPAFALLILLLSAVTTQAQQQTNGYLGVHPLLLSKYSATSRGNLIATLTEGTAPNQVQVVSVPAFYTSGASNSSAWSNLNSVIDGVTGSGRTITVGIALSFHATSTGISTSADTSYSTVYRNAVAQLAAFYQRHLANINAGRVKVVILPSLEDQFSNTDSFVTLAQALVAQLRVELNSKRVSGISSVIIRRSPDPARNIGTATDLASKCSRIAGTSGLGVSCQYEVHGVARSGSVWSNDGAFVYADIAGLTWREDRNSVSEAESYGKMPLTAFTAQAAANRPVNLLWRPAYNLWAREVSNGYVKYRKLNDVRSRTDYDGNAAAFGEQEKTVLRYFLARAPRG